MPNSTHLVFGFYPRKSSSHFQESTGAINWKMYDCPIYQISNNIVHVCASSFQRSELHSYHFLTHLHHKYLWLFAMCSCDDPIFHHAHGTWKCVNNVFLTHIRPKRKCVRRNSILNIWKWEIIFSRSKSNRWSN